MEVLYDVWEARHTSLDHSDGYNGIEWKVVRWFLDGMDVLFGCEMGREVKSKEAAGEEKSGELEEGFRRSAPVKSRVLHHRCDVMR